MEYSADKTENETLTVKLRHSIETTVLRLALIWLAELLCVKTLLSKDKLPDLNKEGKITWTQDKARGIYLSSLEHRVHAKTVVLLFRYRNEFVHIGLDYSRVTYEQLLNRQDDLNALAKYCGVKLNFPT